MAPIVEGQGFESPVESSQMVMVLLTFMINSVEYQQFGAK